MQGGFIFRKFDIRVNEVIKLAKRPFMVPFVYGGVPDDKISTNGIDFNANKLFLMVSNYPITGRDKVYFEFTVTNYTSSSVVSYFPIYVGIHKEPSSGTLSNDFCLGSVFYSTADGKYSVMERHNKTASTKTRDPGLASFHPPAAKEVVGVAIDRWNNQITIYVEGNKLYSFKPSLFNMRNEKAPFYAAFYCAVPAGLVGTFNLGSSGCKYTPRGFNTIHQLYNKDVTKTEMVGSFTVIRTGKTQSQEFNGGLTVIGIKGNGKTTIISTSSDNEVKSDNSFILKSDKGIIYSKLPLPSRYKIYSEIYCRDGTLQTNQLGIPLILGITDSPNNLYGGHTIQIPLHHTKNHCYEYQERIGSNVTTSIIDDVDTSVPNEEGKYIGVGINLKARTIDIWVDKIHFYTYHIRKFFPNTGFYLFIKSDNSFTNLLRGNINLGQAEEFNAVQNPFRMEPPEFYISLWHYYNRTVYNKVPNLPEITCGLFTVIEKYTLTTRYLYGFTIIRRKATPQMAKFRNGLNRMMDTYNTISDRKDYSRSKWPTLPSRYKYHDDCFDSGLDQNAFNNLISSKNNGYFPGDPNNP